jgi:hypothetical protein
LPDESGAGQKAVIHVIIKRACDQNLVAVSFYVRLLKNYCPPGMPDAGVFPPGRDVAGVLVPGTVAGWVVAGTVPGLVDVEGTVAPGLTGVVPVAGTVVLFGVTAPGKVPGWVMLPGTVLPGVTAPGAVDCGLVTLPGTVVEVPAGAVEGCVVVGVVCGYVPTGDVVG